MLLHTTVGARTGFGIGFLSRIYSYGSQVLSDPVLSLCRGGG